MTEIVGKPLSRNAKPVTLTFFDWLKTHPYTSMFYVRDETPDEACMELITAVCALSDCVLGRYAIGHHKYMVEGVKEALNRVSGNTMGTYRWVIKYRVEPGYSYRSHSIPGRRMSLALNARYPLKGRAGKRPDLQHPEWIHFLEVFRRVCVSPEGQPIPEYVELDISTSNWPPKGWKKHNR